MLGGGVRSEVNLVVHPAQVLSFLTKGVLYSRPHDVFLRELVQNSLDSITYRRISKCLTEFRGDIRVSYASASLHSPAMVVIRDNGSGLTTAAIVEELLSPMTPFSHKSKARDPALREAQGEFIGRYGMGLMTAFHVADAIVVTTSSEDEKIGHRVAINIVWKKSSTDGEYEPQEFQVDHTVLRERPFAGPGTEVSIRLASENTASQERIKQLSADIIRLGLEYYLRHVDPAVDITFEHKDNQRVILPKPYIAEHSLLSYYKSSPQVTCCVGPRTNETEEVGTVLCVRGILVTLDHSNLLNDLGRAIVAEVDVRDTRLINLKPSREECLSDAKFHSLKKNLREHQQGFDRQYRETKKKNAFVGSPAAISALRHPLMGVVNEETELIQGYLKTYFLTRHQYVADLILEHVRIRLEAPVSDKRVSLQELLQHCRTLGTKKVFFIYEQELHVDHLCKIGEIDLWWKQSKQFDGAIAVARNRDVIIKLRRDNTRYSIEPLIRDNLEQHGIRLLEMPNSYAWLSHFMEAEPLKLSDLPFPASLIRAGAKGRLAYPHPEGIWLNVDAAPKSKWEAAREVHGFLNTMALSFLGLKFEMLDRLITEYMKMNEE